MNNIFYLNISKPNEISQKMGLCNQLYAIKGTCEYAYENNINTIVIENFLTDIYKNTYCNISDIIDLNHLNNLLKKYNIKVLDWNTDTGFEKIGIEFKSAPYWSIKYDESVNITTYILSNLKFNSKFYDTADEILKKNKITAEPCNVIHLRLENDAVEHWSKVNGLSPEEFKKILEIKYIKNIEKYINKNYVTIVVASEYDNSVIKYLRDNGYLYLTTEKRFKERELNAIVDLIITQRCDRVILGFFESSFVFNAMMRVIKTPKTQKIYFFCEVNNEDVRIIPH
jgi:hypothetical protein